MRKAFTSLALFCCALLSQAQYIRNADASYLGNQYRLTRETRNHGGSARYQLLPGLRYVCEINADLNLRRPDAGSADGIGFVLQPLNVSYGATAGGIAYFANKPSFEIESDRGQDPETNDPPSGHRAFMRNGNITRHSAGNADPPFLLANIDQDSYHTATLPWNATTEVLTVPDLGNAYAHTEDLANTVFSGVPYVYGRCTGATGAAINDQPVMTGPTSFAEEINIRGEVRNTNCPDSPNGGVDISVAGGQPPYSFLWSNGATSEDLTNVPAGNYTVTVTDNAGVSTFAPFTVGTDPDSIPLRIICPAPSSLCFDATGQYDIAPAIVSDNCDPNPTVTYVISGATNRTGTGSDASGNFDPGTSNIAWTVADASGNVASCTTTVTVGRELTATVPDVFAVSPGGRANTLYVGYGPSSLTLQVIPSGGTAPYIFSWSTGVLAPSTTVSAAVPGVYVYDVKVQDAAGCVTQVSKLITVTDARCGNNLDKIVVCHIPPGNPANRHEICISPEAVADHLSQHGDVLATCHISDEREISLRQVNKLPAPAGIYPNPTTGKFEIMIEGEIARTAKLTIMNPNGKIVESKNVQLVNGQSLKIDLGNKPAGVYFVRLITANGIQTQKVIVQR